MSICGELEARDVEDAPAARAVQLRPKVARLRLRIERSSLIEEEPLDRAIIGSQQQRQRSHVLGHVAVEADESDATPPAPLVDRAQLKQKLEDPQVSIRDVMGDDFNPEEE